MRNRLHWLSEEAGTGLLELLVAMPLITALLIAFGVVLCWGIKSYVYTRSDYELQQQVRVPLERIVYDLSCAEEAVTYGSGRLVVTCRNFNSQSVQVAYHLDDPGKEYPKIMRNSNNNPQPMTGETKLADIKITKLFFAVTGRTVYVEISANNRLTKRNFSLHTAVTLPEKG